jgi:hypothetical protein
MSPRPLAGLRDALTSDCERMVQWATTAWANPPAAVVVPLSRWALPKAPALRFEGIAPGDTAPVQGPEAT